MATRVEGSVHRAEVAVADQAELKSDLRVGSLVSVWICGYRTLVQPILCT